MKKFEYKVVWMKLADAEMDSKLNELGSQGWELVSSTSYSASSMSVMAFRAAVTTGLYFFFKRELQ